MERPYSGLTAQVKINNEVIAYLDSVDLSFDKEIIEVMQFGATYKEKVPAVKNWTASAEGTAAFAAGESQQKLYQAYESGELITLGVFLTDVVKFEGQAYVSALSVSGSPDDSMKISAEFEGSGGVTFTLPETRIVSISSGNGGTTDPAGQIRVIAGGDLEITVTPSAGKEADKYFEGDADEEGTTIVGNKISLTNIRVDTKIHVTFKQATL